VTKEPIPVIVYGLGAIGIGAVKLALQKSYIKIVGAVDVDPSKQGKDLGDVIGGDRLGVTVQPNIQAALAVAPAKVVLHTTTSFMELVEPQLVELINAGLHVVSSTEELSYPHLQSPAIAERLDRLAIDKGVSVLGIGVNPGFLMDLLPLTLTGVCQSVESVEVVRVVDTAKRRVQLQKKTGANLSEAEFRGLMDTGRMGHIGLVESVALIADGLGWPLERIDDEVEPVLAKELTTSEFFQVEAGRVVGLNQVATGWSNGKPRIVLRLHMSLRAENPCDRIRIEGTPPIYLEQPDGVAGDHATVAILINSVHRIVEAKNGLLSPHDLPIPVCRS